MDGNGKGSAHAGPDDAVTWGPVFDDDTVRLNLPDGENWVDVKRYITEEDETIATDAAMKDGWKYFNRADRRKLKSLAKSDPQAAEEASQMFYKPGVHRLITLQRMVKGWSFQRNGQPVPVTPENIARLPLHTRDYIMDRVTDLNPRLEEEEDEDGETPLAEPIGDSSTP